MPDEWDGRPQRRIQSHEAREIYRLLGIDPEDGDSVREFGADLYYIREQRRRRRATWATIITNVISFVLGAIGVLISNFIHLGKPTP